MLSWGLRAKKKNSDSPWGKTHHLSYSIHKDDAIDIAYASSMQDVCHMNFVIDLVTTESLWLSGRAMDCGIRRSEVWFLMGTQNFFFAPYSWQEEKHLSPFLFWAQNLPSLLFYLLLVCSQYTTLLITSACGQSSNF